MPSTIPASSPLSTAYRTVTYQVNWTGAPIVLANYLFRQGVVKGDLVGRFLSAAASSISRPCSRSAKIGAVAVPFDFNWSARRV